MIVIPGVAHDMIVNLIYSFCLIIYLYISNNLLNYV
jgi:hypothetical protein